MSETTRPPSPDAPPLIGHGLQFARRPFESMEAWAEYGDVVRLQFPGRPTCLVTDPDLIEAVLVSGPERYERGEIVRRAFGPLRERALSVAEADRWRRLRTAFQPAFTPDRIEACGEVMVGTADRWVRNREAGEVIDAELAMRELTLEVLAASLFGIDVREEGQAVRTVARSISKRSDFTSPAAYVPDWVPTPTNRRFRAAMARLRERIDERIERERAEIRGRDGSGDPESGTGGGEPAPPGGTDDPDFLSALLAMQDRGQVDLTDEELRDNVIGFLWAGQDTTSIALTYLLYALATNPDQRARLEEEVDGVLDGRAPTVEDLDDLPYLDRVIRETLRLYPPAPTTPRVPTEDVTLGGYEVPAGTTLILPQWVLHRDERFWADPERFRPERWTDDLERSLPEYAYFPFGGGPRHCIGMRFARTEMGLAVARIVQSLRFESLVEEPLEFSMAATLTPTTAVRLRVRRR